MLLVSSRASALPSPCCNPLCSRMGTWHLHTHISMTIYLCPRTPTPWSKCPPHSTPLPLQNPAHLCFPSSSTATGWAACLQVGPAHDQASLSRLDGLEVYARPKPDLVREAATAGEADAGAAVTGGLISSLALAAVTLPGHLRAPKPAQTCSVYVLSQGLLTLTSLQRCLTGGVLQ